jgi:peptide/nickel transport system substrate-binding protein/microcin C transport system substrate-binding protein
VPRPASAVRHDSRRAERVETSGEPRRASLSIRAMRKHALRSLTCRFAWLPPAALAFAASAATFIFSAPALAAPPAAAPSAAAPSPGASWVHAHAAFGAPKYGRDFSHFEYADPKAPKGGTLYLKNPDRRTSFDKFNPFTVKGSSPGGLVIFMFESLTLLSGDEPQTMYGLLAQEMLVAPDKSAITFRLHPKARFYNGDPVTAADVLHSFETLRGKYASPAYQSTLAGVAAAVVLDARTIRFDLKERSTDTLFSLGAMPVFSAKWALGADGKPRQFDQIVSEYPITSGPYTIALAESGRRIEFKRNPDYWAAALPVRRGFFNFDRVVYRYYKDDIVSTEAFKAGEFDLVRIYGARTWNRQIKGPKWDDGRIVKELFQTGFGQGLQAYELNLRRPVFHDIRVREAIGLTYDFDTANNRFKMFKRASSLFNNSDFAAEGLPSAGELALLEPFRKDLPAEVFGPAFRAPDTGGDALRLRANLLKARSLLEAAGWKLGVDGVLRNAKGEAFEFEYMTPSERAGVEDWQRNLHKLGVKMKVRNVDFALYRRRLENYDFDMVAIVEGRFTLPSPKDYEQLYGSKSADEKGNSNYRGVKSPAVDRLVEAMSAAQTLDELRTASRALDRVVMWNHWQVPDLYFSLLPTSYWNKFGMPAVRPSYYSIDSPSDVQPAWPLITWWIRDPARR